MDADRFDGFTRGLATVLTRRGGLTALAGWLGLRSVASGASAESVEGEACLRLGKRCKNRRFRCCGNATCRNGRCRCPAKRKRCRAKCIPKAACCGGCEPGLTCRQGVCCIPDVAGFVAALGPDGPATIRLCPGTTYTGNFGITRDVTVIGSGSGNDGTTLDANRSGRVLGVAIGVTAELRGLRLRNGWAIGEDGGGIHNRGTLTLTRCLVTENRTSEAHNFMDGGGGIYNTGILSLHATQVTHNTTTYWGGGIYNYGGTVTLRQGSGISRNWSGFIGGGIDNSGTVTLHDTSRIIGNGAVDSGGGVFNSGTVTLNDASQISGNCPENCAGTNPVDGCSGAGTCP